MAAPVERAMPPALITHGGHTPVEVTLLGHRPSAPAFVKEDPETVAAVYQHLIDRFGVDKAGRRLGILINVYRAPTRAELVEAARREHLSVIHLDVAGAPW